MRILITAGGTSEPIDAVRSIKNDATGRLGMLIANEYLQVNETVEIEYVHDSRAFIPQNRRVLTHQIQTVDELAQKIKEIIQSRKVDCVIHSMAVSDYKAEHVITNDELIEIFSQWAQSQEKHITYDDFKLLLNQKNKFKNTKIGSKHQTLFISLEQTIKVIEMIKVWDPEIQLVGFKLLQNVSKEELLDVAYKQLVKNDELLVVANDKKDITENDHIAYIINQNREYVKCHTKEEIATELVCQVERKMEEMK